MENLLKAEIISEDITREDNIRPQKLNEFIGQSKTKEKLEIFIEAAKKRKETLEHILFYGPPGLGKTTLAGIIANEMGSNIKTITGPSIEKSGDLVAALTSLDENDILFIDEIHRLNKNIEEILYPAMEDYCVDITLNNENKPRTIRISLPKFTLIGATTKAGMLSSPLRDRFGMLCQMEYYTNEELSLIIKRTAKILKIKIDDKSTAYLSKMCRCTPRIANRLLSRVRDYSMVKYDNKINIQCIKDCMQLLEINDFGLNKIDIKILSALKNNFDCKPVGLETLSHFLGEDKQTIEDMYEPFLLKQGYITRTSRGRLITESGLNIIELK